MFRERLTEIRRVVAGARVVCLAAGDGIAVETVGGEDLDVEVLVAEFVAMAKGVASEQRAIGVGETVRLEIETKEWVVILHRLRGDYYLVLALEAGQPVGRARFELQRAAPRFENELA